MNSTNNIAARFLHRFPDFSLDVDLELPDRGVTAIFGPSGSGKTTLLRCIAGLERAQQGQLVLGDQIWQSQRVFIPAHRRPVGYVFQEASLFPHLNALGNLRYAMKRAGREVQKGFFYRLKRGFIRPIKDSSFHELVSLLDLERLLHRYPHQLSGGERQRVAIARALLIKPRLLLMDEPLASLDAARKNEILPYLEALHRQLTIPILYVSHSMDEIMRLADYLVVLDKGKLKTAGPATDVLTCSDFPLPQGDEAGVVWEGEVQELDARCNLARVASTAGELWVAGGTLAVGDRVRLRLLASDVSLALRRHEDSSCLNILPAIISDIRTKSGTALVVLDAGGGRLLSSLTLRSVERLKLEPGLRVWAQIKSVAVLR